MFHVFPRAVSKKECENLLEYCIKNTEFREASMLNIGKTEVEAAPGYIDPKIRKTDIAFVTPDCKEDNQVNEIAWHFLTLANKIKFNYKFDSFQPVQFARYKDGGHYGWHQDVNESGISPNGESRKLSMTFSLSDPNTYEGGHLEFYMGEKPMEEQVVKDIRDQGSVIVFDSRDYHRVTAVTKGVRYSIVCWSVGPNFI
jgi:PKHD-type hydroxylase